ncbi:MAG: heavy-metal-associated domain-containing protein [Ignavibacteria bacterium]|nr:heavy-metal-associated domain-containing protein [Ignavibacteria bacterium]
MTEKQYTISGMSCNHCVMSLKKELAKVAGLEIRDVQVGSALVAYDPAAVQEGAILAAVEEAGYAVVNSDAVAAG